MSDPSPLSEPNPAALNEIFALDPEALTKDPSAADRIIAELRAQRGRWEKAEKAKKGAPKLETVTTDLKLEDLGL